MTTSITEIKSWHQRKEAQRKMQLEKERLETYSGVKALLRHFHDQYPQTKVYLFGSILKKGMFNPHSDIDIALQNAKTDRLQLYAQWSYQLKREIDIVILEKCTYADEILKQAEKVC